MKESKETRKLKMEEFETEEQRRLIFYLFKLSTRKATVKSAVSMNVRNINLSIKNSILRIVRMG